MKSLPYDRAYVIHSLFLDPTRIIRARLFEKQDQALRWLHEPWDPREPEEPHGGRRRVTDYLAIQSHVRSVDHMVGDQGDHIEGELGPMKIK